MSDGAIPPVLLDPLAQQWLASMTRSALVDTRGFITSALLLIEELHDALQQGRQVLPHFQPLLLQMLSVQGMVKVQGGIGWWAQRPREGDAS